MEARKRPPVKRQRAKPSTSRSAVPAMPPAGQFSKKFDAAGLRAEVLKPQILDGTPSWKVERLNDTKMATARQKHGALLENYSAGDVANLTAYLQSLK